MSAPKIRPDWDLNLPDGRGVDLPPPVLPLEEWFEWLERQHEDRVRRGVLLSLSEDPRRVPKGVPFRLE